MKYNNYDTVLLRTERLILNKGLVKDFLKIYEYDFKLLMGTTGMIEFEEQDPDKIKAWFKGGINNYYKKLVKAHMFDWIVYKDGIPIGNVLTGEENLKNNSIELVFNFHPKYWGKGYAPEAATVVIDYLFRIGYDKIICGYLDGDIKSKRFLGKLGFKPYLIKYDAVQIEKGRPIDNYITIMTKEDWFSRTTKISIIKGSL